MKLVKKIAYGFLIFIVLFFLFSIWYKYTYKMEIVESYEINSLSLSKKVLIASQGSEFKNAVVDGVIDNFKNNLVYFKIIDATTINSIEPDNWNAILILHTWEVGKPPPQVKEFISNNINNKEKIIIVSTSGDGSFKMDEIDAFTGASIMEEAPVFIKKVNEKLSPLITN